MNRNRNRRQGTALVIAVGLMSVLAVIGFGFAVVMRLHYDTSRYFRVNAQIELLAQASIYYAIDEIRYGTSPARPGPAGTALAAVPFHSRFTGAISEAIESPIAPWYIGARQASGLIDDDHVPRYHPMKGNSYARVHNELGERVAISYVKVLDSASKINVNDNYDDAMLISLLDSLFYELNVSGENHETDAPPPVDEVDLPSNPALSGSDIITRRNNILPGQRFTSINQLIEEHNGSPMIAGMSGRRFDVLKHYLTIYSWPHEPASVQGYVPGITKPDGTGGIVYDDKAGAGSYRSPININTAPYETLVAILRNVRWPDAQAPPAHTVLTAAKAREVAKWMVRKRAPENLDLWPATPATDPDWAHWESWLEEVTYKDRIRNAYSVGRYWISHCRGFPLGPFDGWNEVIDFLYALTDEAGAGDTTGNDPFPEVLTPRQAEGIIASLNPSSFCTRSATHTNRMGYMQGGGMVGPPLFLSAPTLDLCEGYRDVDETTPMLSGITGKNDVLASSCVAEFQFSSMGRFELESRTFAYVKADMGRSTTAVSNDYSLTETGKSWGITPAQWRGYSVLIYSGTGEGQLRGIVSNTANSVSVAKWLISPDTTSRYFVCGPGPMVDRVDMASDGTSASTITVGNNGAFLLDTQATWEDDQWNGYRVVVYRGTPGAGQLLPGSTARMIYSESIQAQTIQERIIADTMGGDATTTRRLVLSPELDDSGTGHWSYMILGTHGSASHQTVVKAYDVVHQTSEAEFAAAGSTTTHTVVGPNPDGVASTHSDGYLTVAAETTGKPDTVTDAFVLNFCDGDFDPEEGGTRVGAAPAITDVNKGGNLLLDGVHLPADGALHHLDYNVDAAVGIVTQNYDEGDPPPDETVPPPAGALPPQDGGFVEFWFRPDVGCMEGTTERTLIRIVGKCEAADKHDDIRVQMVGTKLRVVVRSSGTAPYMRLKAGRTTPPPLPEPQTTEQIYRLVKCREQNFVPADADSVSVDVSTWVNAYDPNAGMWQPGQWHRIGVGWYESVIIGAVNDDGDNYTDYRCDASPGLDTLDDMQVRGRVTLYVDGVRIADESAPPKGYTEVNAFNLVPPETGGMIHIGEQGKPPAGTIDGVVAYAHTSAYGYFTMRTSTKIARYWSFDHYADFPASQATYLSPIIDLPGTAGKRVALGTARMSVVFPSIYSNVYWLGYRRFPATIAVALNGELTPHSPGITVDAGEPAGGYYNEDGLCTSLPLRKDVSTVSELAGTDNLLWNQAGSSLRYEIKLSAYHWAGTNVAQGFPRFWQVPFVEDVTISYFGPVVFLHWQ